MRSIWEAGNDPVVVEQLTQHAQALATEHNPQLSADVLGLVGFYDARVGDPVRGVDLCREALALTDAHHLRRTVTVCGNSLAQVAVLGGLTDPTPGRHD